MKAVEVLIEHGVPEERIIFINLVSPLLPVYRIDTKLGCTDCSPGRPKNILWEISHFTSRTPFPETHLGKADWLQRSTDNRMDRPRIE